MSTWYRVQSSERDVNDLLAAGQVSEAWNGRDSLTRQGVSVCDSIESLALYLATVGDAIPYGDGDWVIIELTGDMSDDAPVDELEYLVNPDSILSIRPMDDEFFEMIGAAYDAHTSERTPS